MALMHHWGNDPMGAPALHKGYRKDCPAPECADTEDPEVQRALIMGAAYDLELQMRLLDEEIDGLPEHDEAPARVPGTGSE